MNVSRHIQRLITRAASVDSVAQHGEQFQKLTKSYAHCNSFRNLPLSNSTIDKLLVKSVESKPAGDAMVFVEADERHSWEDVYNKAGKFADALLKLGVKKGDRVAIWAPSVPEWTTTQFACARAGFILVTMNPVYTAREAEYALEKVQAVATISTPIYSERYAQMTDYRPKFIIQTGSGELESEFTHSYQDLESSGSADSPTLLATNNDTDQINMIQFTSGTTGVPKAAGLTHRNLVNNAIGIGNRFGSSLPDNRFCVNVPLFHCFGSVIGTLVAAASQNTCVFPSASYSPRAGIHAMQKEKCTYIYGTPTMYIDIFSLAKQENQTFPTVKSGVMAGSICPPELNRQAIEDFGINMTVAYGTTENSPVITGCFVGDSFEKKVNTIGFPLNHIECKVVNDENQLVNIGESGELCARGYQVMSGYWEEDEKTRKVIDSQRWYHTGDLAVMDPEGYVKIIGRLDDMFTRGGENVYPSEIEDVLLPHEDVLDAQVIGVPDKRLGNEIAVYVKYAGAVENEAETIERLEQFCRKTLVQYKIPKYWKFVSEYPTTASGKIQKYKLREQAIVDFDL